MIHPETTSRPTEPFPAAEYEARLRRLRQRMKREKLDAVIVFTAVNRFYLTGFESSNGLLVLQASGAAEFSTDFRYLEQARRQIGFAGVRKLKKMSELLGPVAKRNGWRRVGYEGSIPTALFAQWKLALPDVGEWVDADHVIRELRAVKSRRELAVIRQAVASADAVFAASMADFTPGMTEWAMRRVLRGHVDRLAQREAFDAIIAVGANGSKCHHHPSGKVLRRGQSLLVDMGTVVQGYHSDMTRTVFFGPPSRKLKEIYRLVLEANRKAIRAIRPGRVGSEIDAVARKVIAKAGYGKYFDHGLGHGVGLEIHEAPGFSQLSKAVLKPGMVMTVEPGIYLPGIGGVRIEDMIVVRPGGCEVLTGTPRDLCVL